MHLAPADQITPEILCFHRATQLQISFFLPLRESRHIRRAGLTRISHFAILIINLCSCLDVRGISRTSDIISNNVSPAQTLPSAKPFSTTSSSHSVRHNNNRYLEGQMDRNALINSTGAMVIERTCKDESAYQVSRLRRDCLACRLKPQCHAYSRLCCNPHA